MLLCDTVEFAHVTLGLVPEILNAVDVIMTVCKELGMVDAKVVEIGYIQNVIAAPAVRIDDTIRWLADECEAITEKRRSLCA